MKDTGFAVYLDNSVTGLPVAIFAYASEADRWGAERFPANHHVKPISWVTRPVCPECNGAGTRFDILNGMDICSGCRGTGERP